MVSRAAASSLGGRGVVCEPCGSGHAQEHERGIVILGRIACQEKHSARQAAGTLLMVVVDSQGREVGPKVCKRRDGVPFIGDITHTMPGRRPRERNAVS